MTVDDVIKALGDFINPLVNPNLPTITCTIIKGQVNKTPMPKGPFIVMTQKGQQRLGTNETIYNNVDNKTLTESRQYDIQIDFYGPLSGDRAGIVETVFRDNYASDAFGLNIQPLYCSDAIQMPLVNGEENYEQRWTMTASLQANLDVVLGQQSATTLTVIPVNVEANYP